MYEVHSPDGVWHFDRIGGGFAHVIDANGNDWIGWSTADGAAGEYRGIPNLVFRPGKSSHIHNNFFHPGHAGPRASRSTIERLATETVITTDAGAGWRTRWRIGERHAILDVLSVDGNDPAHWFLYEGTPGGRLDLNDPVVTPGETNRRTLADQWQSTVGEVGWVAFSSARADRSLVICWDRIPPQTPISFWQMQERMTVFGVGRALGAPVSHLTRPGSRFALRLVSTTDPDELARQAALLRHDALPPLRVLAMGDSITLGKSSTDSAGWRGTFVGACRSQGFEVEMLGSRHDGPEGLGGHEGHPGFSITQLRKQLERIELSEPPEVVIVHIGTNAHDHTAERPLSQRYEELLSAVRTRWPEARLLCCTLPMNTLYPERIAELNAALPAVVGRFENAAVVSSGDALKAEQMTVDVDRGGRMVHPNDAGYDLIGRAIANAVIENPSR